MKPSHYNNIITGNSLRNSSDGDGIGAEAGPKQCQGSFTMFGEPALFRIFVMSRRLLLVLTVLVLGCCPAAWGQQKQGGTVRIKQIYFYSAATLDANQRRYITNKFDIDATWARQVYEQIGLSIMRETGEVRQWQGPSPLNKDSVVTWARQQPFGATVPVIYMDNLDRSGVTKPEGANLGQNAVIVIDVLGTSFGELFNFGFNQLAGYAPEDSFPKDTLAHELGHVLLNECEFAFGSGNHKEHATDPQDLLCDGLSRRKPTFSDPKFTPGGDRNIIRFLPMKTREGKYLNQVEAMYTASSYVKAKTPGFPAQMYISLDFLDNGGTMTTTDDRRFSGGFISNSRAGSTPSFVSQVGGRFLGPPAYGSTEIRKMGSTTAETSDPNVPFAISIYERTVDGGANVESSYEFIITPDATTPVNKFTIPPEFTDTESQGCSIQAYRYPQTPISDAVVEVISTAGSITTLTPGTDYQILATYPALVLGRVNALMLGGDTAVLRIRTTTPATETPNTRGDFNADALVNNVDITLLYARMGQSSTTYDLNGDGQVSLGDALELVGLIPGALLGDLNFDGVVNAADLAALNGGWGTAAGRSGGDIDGDGLVTEVDLLLLAGDWQSPPATSHGVLLARPQDRIATPFSRQSVPVWDVSWTASAGVSYQLETSSNLVSWSSLGSPLAGAGNPVRRLVEMPVIGKQGFVRLKGADARQAGFAGSPQFNADRLTWAAQAGEIFAIENWAPQDAVSTNGFWLPVATVQIVTNGNQNLGVPAVDDLGHGKRFRVLRVASVSNTPSPDLAENNAAQWSTFASDNAATSVSNSALRIKDGATAILFTTASGFDTGVKYPASPTMNFDASAFNSLTFWEYPENTTPIGWQDPQPVVVIRTSGGTITLTPDTQLTGYDTWQKFEVPLAGGTVWSRTTTGTPDISHVTQIEIHHDTWDSSFRIWLDGVRFSNSLPD